MGESAIRPSVRVMKGLESWVCPRQSLVGVERGTLQSLGKTVQDAGLQRSDLPLGGLSGPADAPAEETWGSSWPKGRVGRVRPPQSPSP